MACGEDLAEELPYNDYIEWYGPEFKLAVPNNNMENQNSPEYLQKTLCVLLSFRWVARAGLTSLGAGLRCSRD